MYKKLVSIVIPVKETSKTIDAFISGNSWVLNNCISIVVDSSGGEQFKDKVDFYEAKICGMVAARQHGYTFVKTPYILNLDANKILPENFIKNSLILLKKKDVAVVAIDNEDLLGHYGFGSSIWKSNILKELYTYDSTRNNKSINLCECVYMWREILQSKYKIETLPFRAKQIKRN